MNFNEKLQKLRKEKKYSQEELADMLDVTRQSVSKWESGQTYPEMDKLLAICKIFGCTLEELTNDTIKLNEFAGEKKSKVSDIASSVEEFIEKTYHYFTGSTFKDILKSFKVNPNLSISSYKAFFFNLSTSLRYSSSIISIS